MKKGGFTLIELLVVIAIIGILAMIVVTSLSRKLIAARDARAKEEISTAGKSIESFKVNGDGTNQIITVLTTPGGAPTGNTGLATLNGQTTTSGFEQFFIGKEFFGNATTNATYGIKLDHTASTNYTYQYQTYDTTSNLNRLAHQVGSNCYYLDTNQVGTNQHFYILNGNSIENQAQAGPAGGLSGATCP